MLGEKRTKGIPYRQRKKYFSCPTSVILEWNISLPSAPRGHLLSTPHLTKPKGGFAAFLRVLRGLGEVSLTGRNLQPPGRSVYSFSTALGAVLHAAAAHLAHRLTVLSGPIHRKAADSSHLPHSPAAHSKIAEAEALQTGLRDWCIAVTASVRLRIVKLRFIKVL